MSDYNWCHGPDCHKHRTQDRIRGVKGSKVLRTRKIKINNWNKDKKHITRQGKHDDKSRYGTSKKGVPYYVYYDLDAHGYRTATTSWKVRH